MMNFLQFAVIGPPTGAVATPAIDQNIGGDLEEIPLDIGHDGAWLALLDAQENLLHQIFHVVGVRATGEEGAQRRREARATVRQVRNLFGRLGGFNAPYHCFGPNMTVR